MPRTTVDIAAPVFTEAKRVARATGRTLGEAVSELLAEALALRKAAQGRKARPFRWHSQAMGARIDLEDKDALDDVLEGRNGEPADEVAEP
jgi:hypothetical protein